MKSSSVIFLLVSGVAAAQDWNQWRGPGRDGVAGALKSPAAWPKALEKQWSATVGGGYSSPVVANGAVFVFTRDNDEETLVKLDAATGAIAWKKSYPAEFKKNQYALQMAPGPFSTPLTAGGRVYTLGVMGVLTAWDAKSGSVQWKKDFSKSVSTAKLFTGTAMSPVLDSGFLIVHVGDDSGGNVIAYDPASGAEKWNTRTDGPGYASPVIAAFDGVRQLITLTDRSATGLAVADGKQLWSIPYKDEWNENIPTPVIHGKHIIFSGVRKPTTAWRVFKNAGGWSPEKVWENPEISLYMSSPVADGDLLYGMSSKKKGQYFCLDLKTGKTLWTTQGREGNHVSVLSAGSDLLLLSDTADLIAARKSAAGFEQLARYTVADSKTFAHPVPLGKGLLVKDEKNLTLWRLP